MIRYLLKTALRHVVHRKYFSLLNVIGFSMAFATSLIIFFYVIFEYSFDSHHEKAATVYRVEVGDQVIYKGTTAQLLKDRIPEIKNASTLSPYAGQVLVHPTQPDNIYAGRVFQADSAISKMLTFDVLIGDLDAAFIDKSKIAIDDEAALQLFGSTSVIGKMVQVNYGREMEICAVYEAFPSNSTFSPVGFMSIKQNASRFERSESSFLTFLEIEPHLVTDELNQRMEDIINAEFNDEVSIHLRALKDVHFAEKVNYEYAKITKRSTVDLFLFIAFLVLIISVINYYNFKCGIMPTREKNFFVQEVNGAKLMHIRLTLLFEGLIVCVLAAIMAYILVELFSSSQLSELVPFDLKEFSLSDRVLMLSAICISAAIISVLLPTGFRFADTLLDKYRTSTSRSFISMRGVLMTFQFVASLVLIISSIVIYQQKQFLLNYDTGIVSNNVISFPLSGKIKSNLESFTSELENSAHITDVTYAAHGPSNTMMGWGRTIDGEQASFYVWPVAENFLSFFEVKVLNGRDYSTNLLDDNKFIFNQAAIDKYSWEHKLNKKFPTFEGEADLIGFCENFHYASLHHTVDPMCFWLNRKRCNMAFVKYSGSLPVVLEHIESCFKAISPSHMFDYGFVDDTYQAYYKSEMRLFKLISFFSFIALLITAIGITGLVTIITQRHVKEIGIRKANGARIYDILKLLNRKISYTIAIAFVISVPLVWYLMELWMNNFIVHTTIHWYYFLLGGICVWLLAILVTLRQTWKAASQNPIKALRYE
ncbi:ABC transporter permease [Carboxylicivirga sp. A043]|uniref:ABC transporter permease n=1 Tax=Carboxylicivirga litoralis TaxID=2816963 RepID=UPI0021CB6627|nr:ABC transporter permease [Carboxylicivirga sp. A043]MCU4156528.1 ABC transporter permease [Carboxylicivirga sp. A043]